MNDLVDAVTSRIKAPYFGYSLLAFVALNWRGIFLLVVTEGDPVDRLAVFDEATSGWTLIVFPLLVGAAVAASAPWIRLLFVILAQNPLERIERMRLNAESTSLVHKARLERSRSELLAAKEEDLIARAERDQQVSEITNEELRDRLTEALEKLRVEEDSRLTADTPRSTLIGFSLTEVELLKAAGSAKANGKLMKIKYIGGERIQVGGQAFGAESPRDYARYDEALGQLTGKGLVARRSDTHYVLTNSGWGMAESLRARGSHSD